VSFDQGDINNSFWNRIFGASAACEKEFAREMVRLADATRGPSGPFPTQFI